MMRHLFTNKDPWLFMTDLIYHDNIPWLGPEKYRNKCLIRGNSLELPT